MRIAVTGSTGLVGSALVTYLINKGHECLKLVRTKPKSSSEIGWDPEKGITSGAIEGVEGVVHLAGENIAAGRWTVEIKKRIRDSRVKGTTVLSETLASLSTPPKVLVSASAIGYYGDRGDELLNETSSPGRGFLTEVCREWEEATRPAVDRGIRTALLRTGVVLAKQGGALRKMLLPFKLGIGGRLGDGNQYMSWIAIDDLVRIIYHLILTESVNGPVNAVAPNAVTNLEFTKTLGKVLSRPTIFPVPAFVVRLAFGEMGDALLLSSTRVAPARLQSAGFEFKYPQLEGALQHVLE